MTRAIEAAAGERPIQSLSVALVSDERITDLHRRYMNDETPTDVLTFDLSDSGSAGPIDGEIVVSVDTARRQAADLGVELREEVLRYVIHGVLHLSGYDDATPGERRRMRREEDRVLEVVRGTGAAARDEAAEW